MPVKFYDFVTEQFVLDVLKKCQKGFIPSDIAKFKFNGTLEEYEQLEFEDEHLFLFVTNELTPHLLDKARMKIGFLGMKTIDERVDIYIIPVPEAFGIQIEDDNRVEAELEDYFNGNQFKYAYRYVRNYLKIVKQWLSSYLIHSGPQNVINSSESLKSVVKTIVGYLGQYEYYTDSYEDNDEYDITHYYKYPTYKMAHKAVDDVLKKCNLFEPCLVDVILSYNTYLMFNN